jgi:hypothetical protein
LGGEREGEVAEHLDVLVLERRDALEVFVGDLVAGSAESGGSFGGWFILIAECGERLAPGQEVVEHRLDRLLLAVARRRLVVAGEVLAEAKGDRRADVGDLDLGQDES